MLYSTSQWISPVARVNVELDNVGLGNRTHILDGGYDAWKAAGGSIDEKNMAIVDDRAPEFYDGSARGHSAARAGHIPGAHNVYFLTLADSVKNTYLTPQQARAKLVTAGVLLDRSVVVYCHIGQTASVDYVQLRRLGVPVKLYDGSFEEWSRHTDYPVVMGRLP